MPTLQLYITDDLLEKWLIKGRSVDGLKQWLKDQLREEVMKR